MSAESGTFEYDEDIEASEFSESDESDESDEMAFGEADESDESDEDVESDEALDETTFEASDEGEAVDESDGEVDEGLDEAVLSASARLRADRDRNRRSAWARRIAADQRVEARRASTTQQAITRQIQSVRPGVQARVASVGPLQGAGVVTAILPNGRRSRMRIVPTVAPISEVNRLRSVITINDRRQALATNKQSRAIAALAAAQTAAVRKLTAEQVKSDKDLRNRLVEGDNRLDKRITTALSSGNGSLGKHGKQIMAQLKRQRQRQIWNNITIATSLPFWAAFGERQLFGRNNLTLGLSTLGWLLGDELVDSFRTKSGVVKGGANLWSYLAPVGNGVTVFFLLRNRQHERFISGVSQLTGPGTHTIPITANTTLFKKKAAEDFKTASHSVVASFVEGGTLASPLEQIALRANVANGDLLLSVENVGAGETTKVAWIIDTKAEVAVNPTTTTI
jgi:hypothetical protein